MDLNLTTIPYVLGKMETYGYRYKELLTIQEVENSHSLKYPKVQKVEKIILCALKQGNISLEVNNLTVTLESNAIIDLLPIDTITNLTFSDDCRGIFILLSKEYINSLLTNSALPYDIISNRMNHLTVQLSSHEINHFYASLSYIKQLTRTRQEDNTFQQEIISSRLRILFLEFIEILHQHRKTESYNHPPVKSRKSLMTNRFIQLVQSNCSAQRQVSWYASKLCINPTYLSRLLIIHTGKNASYWLKYYLLQNATRYLQNSDLTIQEISDKLGFSNVSSFCRFFKQSMNISPKAFRNK